MNEPYKIDVGYDASVGALILTMEKGLYQRWCKSELLFNTDTLLFIDSLPEDIPENSLDGHGYLYDASGIRKSKDFTEKSTDGENPVYVSNYIGDNSLRETVLVSRQWLKAHAYLSESDNDETGRISILECCL